MSDSKNTKAVAKPKANEITTRVMHKIDTFEKSGELRLPKDYSAPNALKGAQLILADMKVNGSPVLQHCTQTSIVNSLFKMVTMGLSVVKKQGNFIAYGKELSFQEEYTGNIVLAKRYGGLAENPKAHVIYEDDDFEFEFDPETGLTKILKHKPSLASLGNRQKIKGAYCIYKYKTVDANGNTVLVTDVEVMNMEQIEKSWNQGAMKGKSPAHNNFSDQMSKKTVINRACKLLVRGSDDAVLFDYNDDGNKTDYTKRGVDNEISENANQEYIDIEAEEVTDEPQQPEETPKQETPEPKQEAKPEAPKAATKNELF
jgi:recombination protein RecT